MKRTARSLLFALLALILLGAEAAEEEIEPKLLIAFSSYRPRPKHPQVYFYGHDGASRGKILGSVPVEGKRSDHHPALSADGRYCVFASEVENQTSRILLWNRAENKLVEMPTINESPYAQLAPTLSGDAKFVVFAAWNHPKFGGRWDALFYDRTTESFLRLPDLSTQKFDERMPAMSRDGRLIAFATNDSGGSGLTDISLYDLKTGEITSGDWNSAGMDLDPSLSGEGRWIALSSDRPGGLGGRDIYLFDRQTNEQVQLPGLNSAAHEQSPSVSSDGRWIAFVSERIRGEGERDVFLYDRQSEKLIATPGLNDKREDIDPCVIVLPEVP